MKLIKMKNILEIKRTKKNKKEEKMSCWTIRQGGFCTLPRRLCFAKSEKSLSSRGLAMLGMHKWLHPQHQKAAIKLPISQIKKKKEEKKKKEGRIKEIPKKKSFLFFSENWRAKKPQISLFTISRKPQSKPQKIKKKEKSKETKPKTKSYE